MFKACMLIGSVFIILGYLGDIFYNSKDSTPAVVPEQTKLLAPADVYYDLALTLVSEKVVDIERVKKLQSEADRRQRLADLATLKVTWAETIEDNALKKQVLYWLSVHEASARSYVIGQGTPGEIEQQEKQKQQRELAQRLGINLKGDKT